MAERSSVGIVVVLGLLFVGLLFLLSMFGMGMWVPMMGGGMMGGCELLRRTSLAEAQ